MNENTNNKSQIIKKSAFDQDIDNDCFNNQNFNFSKEKKMMKL